MFAQLLAELELPLQCRKGAVSPEIKLGVTLQLLSGGNYQTITGCDSLMNLEQSTVSKIFKEMLNAMEAKLCPKYIKFEFSEQSKTHFFNKHGVPSVVGCIDGTLINILRPTENEHDCYSRKGRHAINAMIVSIFYDTICEIIYQKLCFRYAIIHIKYCQSTQNLEELLMTHLFGPIALKNSGSKGTIIREKGCGY